MTTELLDREEEEEIDEDPTDEEEQIEHLPPEMLIPADENRQVYRDVLEDDPDNVSLTKSVEEFGVLQPLDITLDRCIISGHRRREAALRAGKKTVPCRVRQFTKSGDPELFLRLLREHNRQRVKTADEMLREEIIDMDPEESHRLLVEQRQAASQIVVPSLVLGTKKSRSLISRFKLPFLKAIDLIIERLRDFWPLSIRQIHYQLLNNPPLMHSSKRGSRYRNNLRSYKNLVDLLTRARHEGRVPFEVIHDPTRPITTWEVHPHLGQFYESEINGLLKGYYRNLLQTQPNHVELFGEKNTIEGIIRPIAMEYCIPMTIGRGFSSTPPRKALADRFRASGKSKCVILIVSDHDPDGMQIATSFGRSMRDDFGINDVVAIKVAITAEQVVEHKLPASWTAAKPKSPNYKKFVELYGKDAYEVEALPPEMLQATIRQAVDSVLDIDAFNAEIEAEKRDAHDLEIARRQLKQFLLTMKNKQNSL